jgi:CRP-like cAMP-binding protein
MTEWIEGIINAASEAVFKRAEEQPELHGMGTTVAMVIVLESQMIVAHVGDSRVYLIRDDKAYQLTEDHSYCSEMIRIGKMTKEQAGTSQFSNVITRAVGIHTHVRPDVLVHQIDPLDTYVLCSDGLHGYFQDEQELVPFFSKYKKEDALDSVTVDKLIQHALDAGGKDNVSIIALKAMPALKVEIEQDHEQEFQLTGAHERLQLLRQIPLFRYLRYQELVKVAQMGVLQHFTAGHVVVKEGDPGNELFVLLSGSAAVSVNNHTIVLLQPGSHFGEMALVDNNPRSATVTAQSAIDVMIINRDDFYTLSRNDAVLAVKLLWSFVQVLSRRLRDSNSKLSDVQQRLENWASDQELPLLDPFTETGRYTIQSLSHESTHSDVQPVTKKV